jgi:hypothetical protein
MILYYSGNDQFDTAETIINAAIMGSYYWWVIDRKIERGKDINPSARRFHKIIALRREGRKRCRRKRD